MALDLHLSAAGALVGFIVGLTGMGGGALLTPILVLFFGIPPLAAVSSDLVASLVMKPVGAAVHASRGTVSPSIVRWLCAGSIPAAFAGVLLLRVLPGAIDLQQRVKLALGVALLLAVGLIVTRGAIDLRHPTPESARDFPPVRRGQTVAVGILGGLIVGMTSVGSGSLIIVLLMIVYPTLSVAQLVGTDLMQAIPLVAAAAAGHLLFGNVQLGVTSSLLIGALPAVYLGARYSASAPTAVIRRMLVVVLLASGLKLLDVPGAALAWALGVTIALSLASWLGRDRLRRALRG
jgi:uncharacterized membrane protein YfcA